MRPKGYPPFEDGPSLCEKREAAIESQPAVSPALSSHFGHEASPAAAFSAFIDTIGRLESIVDLEIAMLNGHRPVAFEDLNRQKHHGLLELRRAIDAVRSIDCGSLGLDPKPYLANFAAKLHVNLAVLRRHLDAARAIAAIIARTVEEHESDGTYTPGVIQGGRVTWFG